ncbi:hypothetical protein [Novosphingobium sp.]|uniref:hypothetical protein n=1 Tax=Novosphingobium sp. TaxID=1874826 RepID=UPI00260C66AE|nr:hypothetical protein [Novosphingobium sp.]
MRSTRKVGIKTVVAALTVIGFAGYFAGSRNTCGIFYAESGSGILVLGKDRLGPLLTDLSAFANRDGTVLRMESMMASDSFGVRPISRISSCGRTTLVRLINATSEAEFHVRFYYNSFRGSDEAGKLQSYLARKWGMKRTAR